MNETLQDRREPALAVAPRRDRRGRAGDGCGLGMARGPARPGGADPDRLQHGADRRARRRRQARADRDGDLARRRQRRRAACSAAPVELVYYDDQTAPANVPKIYTKLLERRQGRPRRLGLRHQPDRAGDADRDAQGHGVHDAVRARRQRAVQLRPLLPDHAGRARAQGGLVAPASSSSRPSRASRPSRWSAPMPSSRRTRSRARAPTPRTAGLEIVYDESYPPNTDRLHADHPRDPGDQPGCRVRRLLPAGFRGHGARRERARPQDQAVRRRHGRPAVRDPADQPRADAERHRQLRLLGARADARLPRHPGVPGQVSGARRGPGRRPARPLPAAVRLRLHAGAGRCGRGGGLARSGGARRAHPRDDLRHGGRPGQVRPERRVGDLARADGAVPEHRERRSRAVQAGRQAGRAAARGVEVGRADVPLHRCQESSTRPAGAARDERRWSCSSTRSSRACCSAASMRPWRSAWRSPSASSTSSTSRIRPSSSSAPTSPTC